ncbi:uncharacterized protein [Amphiura filiformis]|uniref:uncharacterized protein n=1 Tax=Amphiura filiformis TaxID=82378 RepID=UPI003B20E43B
MSGQRSINICTYNTRTLRTEESLESLIDELRDLKWDIIGLSETKRAGEGIEELKGGAWLYNHGKTEDNRNAKGIGFMIHPKFKDYIREIKYYSNRVVSLDVQLTANNHLCVVQVYAPTSEYEDEAVEEMYEDVSKAMEESRATYTIVMGDFNAKIGRRQSGEESIMGRDSTTRKNKETKTKEDIEIEELDIKRKILREIIDKTTTQKVEYKETVKEVRKKRRQRSRRKRREQIESILESGKGPKQISKMNSKKTRISQMKDKNGIPTSSREEILNICAEFYQDLYSSHSNQSKPNFLSPDQTDIPNVTVREVETAVKQMKDNKAPGTDDISSDVYKIGGAEIITQLTRLYNQILTEKKIPAAWKEAKIILLHKKGDKEDIKNYRPISLLSHAYKIFTRLIQNRIKIILDENQPREQAGFREGFSTTDHLHDLNQLIEKANEYQLKLCIGYIDYEKAFDSVEHSDLFAALRRIGVNEGYVKDSRRHLHKRHSYNPHR